VKELNTLSYLDLRNIKEIAEENYKKNRRVLMKSEELIELVDIAFEAESLRTKITDLQEKCDDK
jgi:hypothetical protein